MIIEKITDSIIRNVQSIHTLGTKFEVPNIEDLCNQFRAVQLRSNYAKTGRINPQWMQQYVLEYDVDMQDDQCISKFKMPAPLVLDNETDGIVYVGTLKGKCAYRKVPNRAWLALYNNHRNSGSKPICLYENGILEIHGEKGKVPKEATTTTVFDNPFELPDYNMDFSDYPIDNDNLVQMQQILIQSLLSQSKTPTNYKPQNTDPLTTA